MAASFTIGVCQLASAVGTADFDPRENNLARAVEAATRVASRGAELVTFGECFLTGYRSDEYLRRYALCLDPLDERIRELESLCRRLDLHIVIGAAVKASAAADSVYNSALVLGPRGFIGAYHKVHLANIVIGDNRSFDETRYFTRGSTIPVFETPLASFGVQICRDNRYPEVARIQALKGAQVIVNVTAPDPGFMSFWEASTYVRALENHVWYVMSAVVGPQREDNYAGGSRIISPYGEVVARADINREADLVHTIDLGEVASARERGRVLEYRVPSAYQAITEAAVPE